MQNWLTWIPTPRAWVRAIALILLMAGLQYLMTYLGPILALLIRWFPKLGWLLNVSIQLLPIVLIACLHHWLNQFLDGFFPETRLPLTEGTESQASGFPDLLSWWEGVYGWSVNWLSMLVAIGLLSLFLPSDKLLVFFLVPLQPQQALLNAQPVLYRTIQTVVAALLYQFEFRVQQKLISAGK